MCARAIVVVAAASRSGRTRFWSLRRRASLSADGTGLDEHRSARCRLAAGRSRASTRDDRRQASSPKVATTLSNGDQILPSGKLDANKRLQVTVVVKRPGWLSWLTGKTETMHLALTTPVASLHSHFLTVARRRANAPLTLSFRGAGRGGRGTGRPGT